MNIKDTRRAHLEELIARHKNAEAFLKFLNDRLQRIDEPPMTSGYLSQLRIGPPKGRNIGDKVARKLERALGLHNDTLDFPIDSTGSKSQDDLLDERWDDLNRQGYSVKNESAFDETQPPSRESIARSAEALTPERFTELVERYAPRANLTQDQRLRIVSAVSGSQATQSQEP